MNAVLKTSENDNVVTCLRALKKGEEVMIEGTICVAGQDIPQFHKMAAIDIKKGSPVYKYGQVIGLATRDINAGDYAHVHNIESTRGRGDKKEETV
ncbi:MAG: UxaA family hydrolase [Sedimentibacter sp.]|uniref:UxaA family hydrolase n=1 Tax=Sedimentibacter sp. TaxID=1960295 RepID=UPI0031599176